MAVQTFDSRQPVALTDPSEIKPGDWLEDLATLRQVESVDSIGTLHVVHFLYQDGIPTLARGIASGTALTVWRDLPSG